MQAHNYCMSELNDVLVYLSKQQQNLFIDNDKKHPWEKIVETVSKTFFEI